MAPLPASGRCGANAGDVLAPELPFPGFSPGALAVVPLFAGDVLVGSLALAAREPREYGREQVRMLLRSVANVTAAQLARRTLESSLADLARTDPLTRLHNRRAFDEAVPAALGRSLRYGHPASLLLLDVDCFKQVNDQYGHAGGDVVLSALGQHLTTLARDVDVPARLGGDELALLLEHTDPDGARAVAERIRQAFAHTPFPTKGGTFHVTSSVGVAAFPAHARDAATLYEAADAALYRAKRAGGNRVEVAEAPPSTADDRTRGDHVH